MKLDEKNLNWLQIITKTTPDLYLSRFSKRITALLCRRKKDYLNPSKSNPIFESLDGESKLSEAMKSFTSLAWTCQVDYIKEKLTGSTRSFRITCHIPITVEEDERQSTESSMLNKELISIIQSLVGSLNEANHPQFKGLATKKKDDWLIVNFATD